EDRAPRRPGPRAPRRPAAAVDRNPAPARGEVRRPRAARPAAHPSGRALRSDAPRSGDLLFPRRKNWPGRWLEEIRGVPPGTFSPTLRDSGAISGNGRFSWEPPEPVREI